MKRVVLGLAVVAAAALTASTADAEVCVQGRTPYQRYCVVLPSVG